MAASSRCVSFSRAAFPWEDQSQWNKPLLAFFQRAGALRRQHQVLRTGDFNIAYADGDVFAFQRRLDGQTAVVAFNRGEEEAEVDIPPAEGAMGQGWRDVWNEEDGQVQGRTIKSVCIPPRSAAVVVNAG